MLSSIWKFRHFIWASILGEFRNRYTRSRLGLLWSILNPLAQTAIFALVLAEVLGARLVGVEDRAAYPIYLLAGTASWNLFNEIVSRCLNIFMEYSGPLKKIAFPRICLPIIVFGSALINHALLLVAIAIVFLFFSHGPGLAWLVIPVGIGLIALFAFGIGVILGTINVFTRDVAHVMTVVMQLWFWLTPIVYPRSVLPDYLHWTLTFNPMASLAAIYQDALLFNKLPDASTLGINLVVALAIVVLAFGLFRRASSEIVDAL